MRLKYVLFTFLFKEEIAAKSDFNVHKNAKLI